MFETGRDTASTGSPAATLWRDGWALLRVDGPLAARLTADAAAVATILSLMAGLWRDGVAVALFALVLLGQTVLRLVPLRAPVQAGTAVLLVAAAWAALLDAYERISWLDLVMHLLVTGLLAALAVAALLRSGCLRVAGRGTGQGASAEDRISAADRAVITVLTAGVGALLAVLWEIGEWFGHTLLDPAIQVGYDDTVGDLAAGVLGAVLAGLVLDRLITDQPVTDQPVKDGRVTDGPVRDERVTDESVRDGRAS